MPLKLANNAVSRLSASLTAAATTMSVMPGDGAKFPALSAGDWFPLTLVKSDGSMEIVRCTARSTDTFTITRAQEGTAGTAFSAGDRVELRITNAVMNEFALLASPDFSGTPTAPTPPASDNGTRVQTTAGSLSQFQLFGIGATSAQAVSDLDAHRTGGVFTASATVSAAAGLPLASLQHIILYQPGLSSLFGAMFATGLTSNATNGRRIFFRKLNSGTWQPWQELSFLDSPAFTGVPTAPTAAAGTNTTQLATTAFVKTAVDAVATPDASTTVKGKVELATGTEAAAGTDATLAITPSTLRSGLNASGSAPVYACRAWVNFNGTGTVAIRGSGNVISITDNAVGNYTVTFSTPMPDASYCVSASGHTSETDAPAGRITEPYSLLADSFKIQCATSAGGAAADNALVFASVFR